MNYMFVKNCKDKLEIVKKEIEIVKIDFVTQILTSMMIFNTST